MKSTELRRPQASPAKPQIREVQRRGATSAPTAAPEDKPYTDPVCGMKAAANPDKSAVHAGQTYYFCSTGCVSKFTSDPMRYLSPERKNDLYLPDGSGNQASGARQLPYLRHGTRAHASDDGR